jgi:hypothetical protein
MKKLLETHDFQAADDDVENDEDIEEDNKEDQNTKKNFDRLQFNYISLKQILLSKDVR